MKKKVLTVLIICMCLSASGVFAYSKLRPVQGENEFRGIGENMQSSVKSLLSADISLESSPIATYESRNAQDAMGEVLGTKISKAYFDVRYASYKSSPLEYENPKEEAWESIKKAVRKSFLRNPRRASRLLDKYFSACYTYLVNK